MTTILEKLMRHIAPNECIVCCEEGYIVCSICLPDIIDESLSSCMGCRTPSIDYALCVPCNYRLSLSHAFILGVYENELKQLVYLLKYEHVHQVASDLAEAWQHILPVLPKETVVTHIPTTGRRQRARGFDQAALLARELAAKKGLMYKPLLRRIGNAKQVGATREQRFKQAASMFEIDSRAVLEDKVIVLVDDVITTGATITAAAALLRQAGAAQVMAVAIARQHLEKR